MSPIITLILLVILIIVVGVAAFFLYIKKDSSTTFIKPNDTKSIKTTKPTNKVDFDQNGLPIKPQTN